MLLAILKYIVQADGIPPQAAIDNDGREIDIVLSVDGIGSIILSYWSINVLF